MTLGRARLATAVLLLVATASAFATNGHHQPPRTGHGLDGPATGSLTGSKLLVVACAVIAPRAAVLSHSASWLAPHPGAALTSLLAPYTTATTPTSLATADTSPATPPCRTSAQIGTTALRVEDRHAGPVAGAAADARLAAHHLTCTTATTPTSLATADTSPATPPCRTSAQIGTTALRVEDRHAGPVAGAAADDACNMVLDTGLNYGIHAGEYDYPTYNA